MQTRFPPELLADPAMASSEAVIRKCVHCGFCTATCPTYVLLGDELDSPRGRIYLMKDMLENERAPTAKVVKHIDRCLSCLSCMTTCPSGVNYMHLVDHARSYIEERYRRPWRERLLRTALAAVLPYPGRLRMALALARIARPAAPLLERFTALKPIATMLALAPARARRTKAATPQSVATPLGRVALLQGCAEPVLRPEIREASIRMLRRAGHDVVLAAGEGCCGALVHHLGKEEASLNAARRNVDAWMREIDAGGLEAIVVSASGCGTTIKDYGFMLRNDPAYATNAARISALAKDVSEVMLAAGLKFDDKSRPTVAYQAPCSLQHGQKVDAPRELLKRAGFAVETPVEQHLCCGSAGTYNILQPDLAEKLGKRKTLNLENLRTDIVATSNIGCATHITRYSRVPVVHVIELLDWAMGGPRPTNI